MADDNLYFLGRAFTNLDLTSDAISYYQKLLSRFPDSNYSDDALYRIGRIYFFKQDMQNATSYYQKVFDEYPNGDRLSDALWELGWIQYSSGDYNSAKTTFSNLASSYKGTSLEEKGLFWQAKCHQKLRENDKAIDLYKNIKNPNILSLYNHHVYSSQTNLTGRVLSEAAFFF
ncbi:unnamed protein product [marine sediment metagenome]|uniref:Uncharacterized protein n=1 Tax=marine sediment metagenome TaxID=412755 RepID=X1CH73_9ZZZZ